MKTPKASLSDIRDFLNSRKIAVAGVSRDPKKFGNQVFKELKERGFELYPVNPNAERIDDVQVFAQLSLLPEEVKHLLILTHKRETEKVVMEAIAKGISHIWIQQMSETPEAVRIAKEAGVRLVTGQCIFMWADPVKSIHKFHKSFLKFFGLLPR